MPKQPWQGIRNAIEMGQQCIEGGDVSKLIATEAPTDIEDCLNLNIFTPAIPHNFKTELLFPVMFYIHGGSFSTGGNAEYPPLYLLEHDIILVVPNYRLDALGNDYEIIIRFNQKN